MPFQMQFYRTIHRTEFARPPKRTAACNFLLFRLPRPNPFEGNWGGGNSPGTHFIVARATDSSGRVGISKARVILIRDTGSGNRVVTVLLGSPQRAPVAVVAVDI